MSDILKFAKSVAIEAGDMIVKEREAANLSLEFKAGNELVTSADLKADDLISNRISVSFPGHLILSEESAPDVGNVSKITDPLWIVDPIDGTVNYAHGHAQSAVSIAYAESGKVIVAVVYNPFTAELFSAEAGAGAYLNDARISVATETELKRAIIATGFPYDKTNLPPMINRVGKILTECADIRRLGAAALDICWVAVGRLDGFYESLSLWDFAAAQLIAREAGAQYGHFSEVPEGISPEFHCQDILVANPALYGKLHNILVGT